MKFVPRRSADLVDRLLKAFPAVLVVGPRQCGKSTLVRRSLADWHYVDLELPSDAALIRADPEGYLRTSPRRLILDEAQRVPEVFPVLRHMIDRGRGRGRFVLLGSASPDLMKHVSETLAGRIALIQLTPLRAVELARSRLSGDRWFWGGYPGVHALKDGRDRAHRFDAYVTTFLERDLGLPRLRLPPERLRKLWMMLTHVHGNLLNVSDLARSLTVSQATVANDLDVLEGAFMIRRLPPLHVNTRKRLTKSPKLYIRDSGLLHFMAGLREPAELDTWPRRGHSFEGLVIE